MTIIDLSKDTIESAKKRYSYQAQSKDHHRYDYNNNNDDNDNDDIDYHNQQPREIRKSVRALHIMHSHISREIITDIVTYYCKEHSTQKDDNEIDNNPPPAGRHRPIAQLPLQLSPHQVHFCRLLHLHCLWDESRQQWRSHLRHVLLQ